MWFKYKSDIFRGLVGKTNFSWRWDECLEIFEFLKINVLLVFIDTLSILILICIKDLILFTHPERVSKSSFLRFAEKNFKAMFPIYGFRLKIFRTFGENIS